MARTKISKVQGETIAEVFTYYDSTGALVNLTGYAAQVYLKRKVGDSTTVLDLSSAVTMGGSAGPVTVNITRAQSLLLSGNYSFDVFIISGSSAYTCLAQCDLYIAPTV